MKIALDITSGDLAPKSTINGAKKYLKNNTTSKLILIGRKSHYKSIKISPEYKNRIEFIEANQSIDANDRPSRIIKTKPDSSIVKSISLLKSKKIDAVVSAGNTGCLLASSLLILGKIKEIS